MLQILLFIITIGITLFLWERFKAFKWIFVIIAGVPIILIIGYIFIHQLNIEVEKNNKNVELKKIKINEDKEEKDFYKKIEDPIKLALNSYDDYKNQEFKINFQNNFYKKLFKKQSSELKKLIQNNEERNSLLKIIWYESMRSGIEPSLTIALIEELSNFNQFNISNNSKYGYLAVPSNILEMLDIKQDQKILFDKKINLRIGLSKYRELLDKNSGDVYLTLKEFDRDQDNNFPERVRDKWKKYQ